jgi:hypothetical protein
MTDQVNIPLLRKAVEWAEAEATKPPTRRLWWQGDYRMETACGTAFCIAGYVGQMLDDRYAETTFVDGTHVADFAAEALGIDADCADGVDGLFSSNNSIEDVRRIAEEIAGERL